MPLISRIARIPSARGDSPGARRCPPTVSRALRAGLSLLAAQILMSSALVAGENPDPTSVRTLPPSSDLVAGYRVEIVASDLRVPWGMAFLPDGSLLFTEREGTVRRLAPDGTPAERPVLELRVAQGLKLGLLDLCLDPAFPENGYVYLAYNYILRRGADGKHEFGLRIMRYTLSGDRLITPLVLKEGIPAASNHTGCRLVFGRDGMLYLSTGDANQPGLAQRTDSLAGKILRITCSGAVPPDNPYAAIPGARPEVWSLGHRNIQGLAVHPVTGTLYASEHGPNGGDEINLIDKGRNFGWPLVTHRQTRSDMVAPLLEVTPSIAPAGCLFYTGEAFPELKGKLLVALLRGEGVLRVTIRDGVVQGHDRLFHRAFGRLRTIAQSREGFLYLATSQFDPPEGTPRPGYDLLLRIVPSGTPAGRYPVMDLAAIATEDPTVVFGERLRRNRLDLEALFAVHCASCHGPDLGGGMQGSLLDGLWNHGGTPGAIRRNIAEGIPAVGMPAAKDLLTEEQMDAAVAYILRWQVSR